MRQKSFGRLRWEGAYSTPRRPSWIYGEDRERRGNRKGRKREKEKGEREGEWQIGCKAGKAGIEGKEKDEAKRDGRREGKGQEGR